jgi:hypothetical protein
MDLVGDPSCESIAFPTDPENKPNLKAFMGALGVNI